MIDSKVLMNCINNNLNVLMIGPHGAGKTTVAKKAIRDAQLTLKYFSSSTIDPWADLVGIPMPMKSSTDSNKDELKFIRPKDVDEAEVIFFDELNRAHPKVLNAVMEIIQFKSINGEKLPKLKMVWAAINPPGGPYQVNDLDPALADRFHIHVAFASEPSEQYLSSVCGSRHTAKEVVTWWKGLTDNQREVITPRRLEYLCLHAAKGVPLQFFVPFGNKIAMSQLEKVLSGEKSISYDNLREDEEFRAKVFDKVKSGDVDTTLQVVNALLQLTMPQLQYMVEFIEVLPNEAIAKLTNSPAGARWAKWATDYHVGSKRQLVTNPNMSRLLTAYDKYVAANAEATKGPF